jgi:hypothetical protein
MSERTVPRIWQFALISADRFGDLKLLVRLFRSPKVEIGPNERALLAAWLDRLVIAGTPAAAKGGRRRKRLFELSADDRLSTASDRVDYIKKHYRLPKNKSVTSHLRWLKQHPLEAFKPVEDGREPTENEAIQWAVAEFGVRSKKHFANKRGPGGKLANYRADKRGSSRRPRRL